jgi:elongation factor P
MAKVNTIKRKNVIRYNNDPCIVNECVIRTPPNLTSFCQMTLRNLVNGKVVHVRCPVSESFDVLPTEQRKVEYSYENQGIYAFMDNDTFELIELNREIIEDAINYLVPGNEYELYYVDGSPLTINLPSAVDMKVVEAPEAIRGDTSGNVQKPVTMETGLTVMVPLFIKEGETIRISTDDGSYLGRSKD